MIQTRDFFFFSFLDSKLLNNLPIYHCRFGQERDYIHGSVHNRSNHQFFENTKVKESFGNLI